MVSSERAVFACFEKYLAWCWDPLTLGDAAPLKHHLSAERRSDGGNSHVATARNWRRPAPIYWFVLGGKSSAPTNILSLHNWLKWRSFFRMETQKSSENFRAFQHADEENENPCTVKAPPVAKSCPRLKGWNAENIQKGARNSLRSCVLLALHTRNWKCMQKRLTLSKKTPSTFAARNCNGKGEQQQSEGRHWKTKSERRRDRVGDRGESCHW